jgi:hypothetical protein
MKKLIFLLFLTNICFGQQYANNFDGTGSVPTGAWSFTGTQITTGTTVNSNNTIPTGGSSSGGNHLLFSDCGTAAGNSSVIVSGINMVGKTNIKIGFDIRKTNSFSSNTPIDFSIDGGSNWINLANLSTVGANNSAWSFNSLNLPTSANNQADIRFRITFPNILRACTGAQNLRIDDFIVFYGASPFPVKLSQLSANIYQEKQAIINWQTSSEVGFSHFEVQRSGDAKGFETIGRAESKGQNTDRNEYVFIDGSPIIGQNYYRLKSVDLDGTEEYSKIIGLNFNEPEGLVFYPNPAVNALEMRGLESKSIEKINVYNNVGLLIGSPKVIDNKIDVSTFAAQLLWVEAILTDKTIYRKKIVKF